MDRSIEHYRKTYDEAILLLMEATEYFSAYEAEDKDHVPAYIRFQMCIEMERVTIRVTQAMAWLMAERAVYCKELSGSDLGSGAYSLNRSNIYTDPSGPDNEGLSNTMRSLLKRSHELYMRVIRLDDMVRNAA